jgi:uncharacterized protein
VASFLLPNIDNYCHTANHLTMKPYALITGASSGIGLELAHTFAKNGYNLVLVARSREKMEALAAECHTQHATESLVIEADLSDRTSAQMVFDTVKKKKLVLDVLVNNAGFGDTGEFASSDWQKQEDMMMVNMIAAAHLTRLFVPQLIEQKNGYILNVASVVAFLPGPLMSIYFATKAFLLSFSEALSEELKNTGVSVTVLCPGVTESGFQKVANIEESKFVKGKKMPSAAEVAEFGYTSMIARKVVVVHGFSNYMLTLAPRFFPRSWIRTAVKRYQGE